jgi:hypothetical protein
MLPGDVMTRIYRDEGSRLIGTHMDPPRTFHRGVPEGDDWFRIICEAPVTPFHVLITAAGGLFVRVPQLPALEDDPGLRARLAFQISAAAAINKVLCDLALAGQVSAAASPTQMGTGRELDGVAAAVGAGGGRETYMLRAMGPLPGDHTARVITTMTDPDVIRAAVASGHGERLGRVSPSLPELVVGAYTNFSRHHAAEAAVDAFVVIEQLIDVRWKAHIDAATEPGRKDRLRDTRSFTTSIRTEVLLNTGALSRELYDLIEPARQHRNEVAHRAKVDIVGAERAVSAMHAVLEDHLGATIAPPQVVRGTSL